MANLKDIKAHMKGYRFMDLAARDVQSMQQHYKDLKPGSENYVHTDGRREQLFRLRGTIPVSFRGANYNIPVVMWLQKTHPQSNPIVYVTPTPDMSINPSRYVDGTGRVYLPYLTDWKKDHSDLATLVQVLSATFAENIPVYSRQQQQGYVPPAVSTSYRPPMPYSGSGYQQPPMPYPPAQPNPPYPVASRPPYTSSPYPTGQMPMPTPAGYPPYAGGGGYPGPTPPYPPQPGQPSYTPYPQTVATSQALLSAEEERRKIEEEERERAKIKRTSLESAVEDKIKRQLENVLCRAQDEMTSLKQTQTKLKENNEKLTKILQDMDNKQHEVDNSIQTLKEKTTELESVIEYLQTQPDKVDVDESVVATNPVYNQILKLYAEENAIDDTIYYLGEALRRGVITHEAFLKHVRDLSRKQFMARATIMKARDAAKLPPHGIPV